MNNRKKLIFILIVFVFALSFIQFLIEDKGVEEDAHSPQTTLSQKSNTSEGDHHHGNNDHHNDVDKKDIFKEPKKTKEQHFSEFKERISDIENRVDIDAHEKSMLKMNQVVFEQVFNEDLDLSDFKQRLEFVGLKPIIKETKNTSIGSFADVRLYNNLPGTRYLHASFEEDTSGRLYPQHISYEYKPGEESFEQAVEDVSKLVQQIGTDETLKHDDYYHEKLKNEYDIRVRKLLTKEDLASGDLNSRGPQDKGTVRIVIERAIHRDTEHGHAHDAEMFDEKEYARQKDIEDDTTQD